MPIVPRLLALGALGALLLGPAQADAKRLSKEAQAALAVDEELVRAMHQRDRGELQEALATVQAAIASHPDSIPAHLLYQEMAAVVRRNGPLVEAEYRHWLNQEPDDARRMVLHAAATLTAGLTTRGYFEGFDRIRELERALAAAELSEGAASYAHLVYAEVEQVRSREDEVVSRLKSAVQADPLNLSARSELLLASLARKDSAEATKQCLELIAVAPWRVAHCRALFPAKVGDTLIGSEAERKQVLDAVAGVEKKAEDRTVLEGLRMFWSVADASQTPRLETRLQETGGFKAPLERNPYLEPLEGGELTADEMKGIERLIEVVDANENPKARVAALRALEGDMPDSPRVQAHYYRTLAQACRVEPVNKRDESRAALRKAVELQPDDASLLNEWAYMSAVDKVDLAEALAASDKALAMLLGKSFDPIQIEPLEDYGDWSEAVADSAGAYLDTRGWVLYQLGRYDEALQQLQLASTLTLDGTVEGHLGRARYALGQDEGAFLHLLRALALGTEDEVEVEKLAGHIYSKTRVVPGGLDQLVKETHRQILNEMSVPPPAEETVDQQGALFGADSDHPLLGQMAPELNLVGIDGEPIALSSLRGKVVVVDFWATWCGPCRQSLPMFETLSAAFEGQAVFVMASVDDTLEEVQDFWSGLDMPVEVGLVQERGAEAYSVSGIPAMFIIGRDGEVVGHHVGFEPEEIDALAATLAALASEK